MRSLSAKDLLLTMASSFPAKSKRIKIADTGLPVNASLATLPKIDRQALWICVGLVIAVCIFYYPVVRNGFVYDDDLYILKNSQVRDGLSWSTIEWAFTSFDEANWHPLTWLSHALDCQIFGAEPCRSSCRERLATCRERGSAFLLLEYATGFRWRSLMVAALFALHPINVESVAWAAERKNVLSMLFFLARAVGLRLVHAETHWRQLQPYADFLRGGADGASLRSSHSHSCSCCGTTGRYAGSAQEGTCTPRREAKIQAGCRWGP